MKGTNTEHTILPFPSIRKATVGALNAARHKNMIHSLIEVDIENARKNLQQAKRKHKVYLSFTAYLIHCIARAVDRNKIMHAYRNRKNRLVLFSEVDVSTTIERTINGDRFVLPVIIRGANHKSVAEISKEIREEKEKEIVRAEVYRSMRLFLTIPSFIRQFVFRWLDRSPVLMKKRAGTIMVTSVNMVGKGAGWGMPVATHTLNVAIGGIAERVVAKKDQVENRQQICLTVSFDHDIVDGAPAARFIRDLKKSIEKGDIKID